MKLVAYIFLLCGIMTFEQRGLSQTPILIPVDKGTLTLSVSGTRLDEIETELLRQGLPANMDLSVHIEGSLRNNTAFDFTHVYLELTAYNANGDDLKLCNRSPRNARCGIDVFESLSAGQVVQLKSPGNVIYADPSRLQSVAKSVYHVTSAPYRVKYQVEARPILDSQFTILSVFGLKGIALEFRSNIDVIEVLWDQSSYIDETGNSSRLIRSNVRLSEKDRPQPNSVIPPGTKLQETIFPIDHIRQNGKGELYQAGLFPELAENGASIQNAELFEPLKGKTVRLFLQLLVGDKKINVTIPFEVVAVNY